MLLHHMLFALRQIVKTRIVSAITLASLSCGIVTLVLIIFYCYREWQYDRHHPDAENIYRVVTDYKTGSEQTTMAWTSGAVATEIQSQVPAIKDVTRLFRYRSPSVIRDRLSGADFSESNFLWADSNVFNIFSFEFIHGSSSSALQRPNTMVITESTSMRYFGTTDAIGKVLSNATFNADFEITGIVRDMPDRSHFKADFICSLSTLPKLWGSILESWGNSFLYTYIKIHHNADLPSVKGKLNTLAAEKMPATSDAVMRFSLQPLTSIHLYSHVQNEWHLNSDITYIYMLMLTGVLILLIAIVNFVNFGIARAENRIKEIGIRQTLGSTKNQLVRQFIVENLITVSLAFIAGILLVEMLQPLFVILFREDLVLTFSEKIKLWSITLVGLLVLVLITTLYPARIISRLSLAQSMKGAVVRLYRGVGLWQSLVGFQVFVTVLLLSSSLLIYQQLSFMADVPKGYHPEKLLSISLLSDDAQAKYERLKVKLLQNPGIKAASACSHLVGEILYQSEYSISNKAQEQTRVMWQRIHVDPDFCNTYGIQLVAGRDFSKTLTDTASFIINESSCRQLGFNKSEEAIGLPIEYDNGRHGTIIGVMKDFHFKTLHQTIEPMIVHIVPERFRMLTINMDTTQFAKTLSWIKNEWNSFDTTSPFVYSVHSELPIMTYGFERKFASLILFFTVVAIVLSAGGIIGLMLYIVTLKRKEISVRKVLGAEIFQLSLLFAKRFAWINLAGVVCAIPLAWYGGYTWLNNFAYRIEITFMIFMIAGIGILILSAVSVAFPLLKAIHENPAQVLNES